MRPCVLRLKETFTELMLVSMLIGRPVTFWRYKEWYYLGLEGDLRRRLRRAGVRSAG